MKRKMIPMLIFIFLLTLFLTLFKNNFKTINADDTLVGTPEVGWNNVDYSYNMGYSWTQGDRNDVGVPQEGYCLLPLYPSNIALETHYDVNLLESNIDGCNVGDHILINGKKAEDTEGTVIYAYPTNGFFIYVPRTSIEFSNEYEYVTIEVLEGMSIDGAYRTVGTRFEYRGLLRSFNNWKVNPEPVEYKQSEFVRFEWNNVDFSYTVGAKWCDALLSNGSPKNGYCVIAFFKEEGKTMEETVIGDISNTGRGVIDQGLSVDYKIKVNGVNIIDVDGAKCYLFPNYGLFFYIPDKSVPKNTDYKCLTISLDEGIHFNDVMLPKITFEFRGQLGQPDCWTYLKDPSEYNHFEFTKVADGWNNVYADSLHTHTILQFGEHGVDYLRNNQITEAINMVNPFSDCGLKISINGVPLSDIEEAVINYAHGYSYFYLSLPVSVLNPSNGYKIVTLHIDENTIFYDTMLPELDLYLYNGSWVLEKPLMPSDEDFDESNSLEDVFDSDEIVLDSINKQLLSNNDYKGSFIFYFDYKLLSKDSAFSLLLLGDINGYTFRLDFKNNEISLFNQLLSNPLIGSASLKDFNYDDYYSLLVKLDINDKVNVSISIDDITYINVNSISISNLNSLSNVPALFLTSGNVNLRCATAGVDNKKPILSYTGKNIYRVEANSDIIDFSNKCNAYDKVDGDITKSILYIWPEGAITNGKINKGIWNVSIKSIDSALNESVVIVEVISIDKNEAIVTFDNENPTIYKIGDHIKLTEDPIKIENNKTYRFIGWYYGDILWDFENDIVKSDMNLLSKFQETVGEYSILFEVEGLGDLNSFVLYFTSGTTLDLSIFDRNGYTLKSYNNDSVIENITIKKDETIKLVYTKLDNEPINKKGCKNSAVLGVLFLPLSISALVILKRRGGKENE